MPKELYEQRMKQIKEWLDNGDISGNDLLSIICSTNKDYIDSILTDIGDILI